MNISKEEILKILMSYPPKIPQFVKGVYKIVEMRSFDANKIFYLMGEYHLSEFDCKVIPRIPIQNLLVNLLESNTDKIIDIFLEVDFVTPDYKKRKHIHSPIEDIHKKFEECLKISKVDCPYKNLRMHYSDVRVFIKSLRLFHTYIYNFLNTPTDELKNKIFSYSEGLPINADEFLKVSKIAKQLENTVDDRLKSYLENQVREAIIHVNIRYNIIANVLKKNIPQDKLLLALRVNYEEMMDSAAWFVDVYIIARSFRRFDEIQRLGPSPRYIIAFVGGNHVTHLYELLKRMGFYVANSATEISPESMCTEITPFIPFFKDI